MDVCLLTPYAGSSNGTKLSSMCSLVRALWRSTPPQWCRVTTPRLRLRSRIAGWRLTKTRRVRLWTRRSGTTDERGLFHVAVAVDFHLAYRYPHQYRRLRFL